MISWETNVESGETDIVQEEVGIYYDSSLEDLAITANEEHDAFVVAGRTAVEHALRAGQALIEAKARMEHGLWMPWVEFNCRFSHRTATKYMTVSSNWNHGSNLEESPESIRQALGMLTGPAEESSDNGETSGKDEERERKKADREARKEAKRVERVKAAEEAYEAVERSGGASWKIVEGDCIEELSSIPAGTVRLLFADPPYNQGVEYGEHCNDRRTDSEYLEWCVEWMQAAFRTLTKDGSMWVVIAHEYAADFEYILRDDCGLTIRNWITWYETFGVNCARKFTRSSRRIFHAVVDPDSFVFNPDPVTRPSDRQVKYDDKRANPDGRLWDDVWGVNPPIPRLAGTHKERISGFPTQLPLDLIRPIVGCASNPGDLVVDPFSGSGTTGAASIEAGRRYLGIERSAEFARRSRERLLDMRLLWEGQRS